MQQGKIGAPYLHQAKLSGCNQLPPEMHPRTTCCQSSIESAQSSADCIHEVDCTVRLYLTIGGRHVLSAAGAGRARPIGGEAGRCRPTASAAAPPVEKVGQ